MFSLLATPHAQQQAAQIQKGQVVGQLVGPQQTLQTIPQSELVLGHLAQRHHPEQSRCEHREPYESYEHARIHPPPQIVQESQISQSEDKISIVLVGGAHRHGQHVGRPVFAALRAAVPAEQESQLDQRDHAHSANSNATAYAQSRQ